MSKRLLSIEVGQMQVKVADVVCTPKMYSVEKSFVVPTPADCFDDGYIVDNELLSSTLFTELHKRDLYKRKVVFTINSTKIISREVELPYVAKNKIKNMLLANASEYFPVDLSAYKLSWKLMKVFTVENMKKMSLVVTAVPLDLLDGYYELAKGIGMTAQNIDYAGNSIYQLTKNSTKEEAVVSVDVGDRISMVTIIRQGVLELHRVVPIGAYDIVRDVADVRSDFDVNPLEYLNRMKAEPMINGVLPMDTAEEDESLEGEELLKAHSTSCLRLLIDKIGRVIRYYNISTDSPARLGEIILSGSGAGIQNLMQLIQFEMGMLVSDVKSIKNIQISPNAKSKDNKEKVYSFQVLEDDCSLPLDDIAAGLGSLMDPLELLSNELYELRKKQNLRTPIICCVVGLVVSAGMSGYGIYQKKSAENQKAELEAQITELSAIEQVIAEHGDVKAVYDSMKDMNLYTRNFNEDIVKFFAYLEENLPSSAVVSEMSITETGIVLTFETKNWEESAETFTMLQAAPNVASVSLDSVTKEVRTTVSEKQQYMVDGVLYDSLDDVNLKDENGDYKDVTVIVGGDTLEEPYCKFTVTCAYKNMGGGQVTKPQETPAETQEDNNKGEEE